MGGWMSGRLEGGVGVILSKPTWDEDVIIFVVIFIVFDCGFLSALSKEVTNLDLDIANSW